MLVEVQIQNRSENLLKQDTLAQLKVTVTSHHSLIQPKAESLNESYFMRGKTFFSKSVTSVTDQGVTAVRRITMRRAGEQIQTKHVAFTLNCPALPESVHAAFIACPVRPYMPNSRRCFKLQKYGHGTQSCHGHCSNTDHTSDGCSNQRVKCPNFSRPHPAFSRACPSFKKEKEIIQLNVTENLVFPQALLKHV